MVGPWIPEDDTLAVTTIKLDSTTRDRLKLFGHKGESYDEILRRLMDSYKPTIIGDS